MFVMLSDYVTFGKKSNELKNNVLIKHEFVVN